MLQRFPDWPHRLSLAIEERRRRPHAWGSNDCAMFAADLVAVITGHDFAALFRGRYSDEDSAKAVLAAHGWKDLEALADHCLPRRQGRPHRGDVVLQEGTYGPYLGIVWQGGVVGPDVARMKLWPMQGILACWAVG